jgi:hypothetical protein
MEAAMDVASGKLEVPEKIFTDLTSMKQKKNRRFWQFALRSSNVTTTPRCARAKRQIKRLELTKLPPDPAELESIHARPQPDHA